MNPTDTSAEPIDNPLSAMQDDEVLVCQIKRHPIGLLGIYLTAGSVLIVIAVLVGLAPTFITSQSRSQVLSFGVVIFLVIAVITLIFTLVANKVYWGNRWIVSSDSVTELTQLGLFNTQKSQLSLGNLEDVTVVQNTALMHMLNYGTLRLETAGERSKFVFPYCPNPNDYAQKVLHAREDFEQGHRGGADLQRLYRGPGSYTPQNQTSEQQPQPASDGSQPPQPPSE